LLNDFSMQQILQFEVGGYPKSGDGQGVAPALWKLIQRARRTFEVRDEQTGAVSIGGFTQSIEELEAAIDASNARQLNSSGHRYSFRSARLLADLGVGARFFMSTCPGDIMN
jgi:hypothetical protein